MASYLVGILGTATSPLAPATLSLLPVLLSVLFSGLPLLSGSAIAFSILT